MQLEKGKQGVDIGATFEQLDRRITALENKDKPAAQNTKDGKPEWTPAPPKKA